MPASLHAYAHLEDAWAGGVEAWCRESTALALGSGTRSWLVCATRGQGEWVKSRLLRAGVPLLGLHFLQAASLRRELCLRLGESPPRSEHEVLTLVVRALASAAPDDRRCVAIAQQPAEWLRGLEDLDATGWLDDAAEFARYVPKPLRAFARELRKDAGEWLVGVDRRLRDRARDAAASPSNPRLLVLGWEASCFLRANLLAAAVSSASSSALFVPLPRVANEALQQAWHNWIAGTLSTNDRPCPSQIESVHAAMTGRLEGVDLTSGSIDQPQLLVGKSWGDQIELIAGTVARWLTEHAAHDAHRLAVVLPTRNATSVALGRRLAELGLKHENTIGERPEPAWEARLLRALVEYQHEGCSAAAFLRLLSIRAEGVDDSWRSEAEQKLATAFEAVQSGLARHVAIVSPFSRIVAEIGEWRNDAPASDRQSQLLRSIDALQLPPLANRQMRELLEPIWPSLERWFPQNRAIAGTQWLEFLDDALGTIPTAQAGGAAHARHARIVLTTLADAANQTWQGVILADANDEIWPFPIRENPQLPDTVRSALNARRAADQAPLLTESDRAGMEDARFLTLLENCAGPFWFAASGALADAPHRASHPNEWVLRCLIESTPNATGAWAAAHRRTAPREVPLETEEAGHLTAVRKRRQDPQIPFDEFFLRFGPIANPPKSLQSFAARTLERLVSYPAEVAYQLVFDASTRRGARALFTRDERRVIGNVAHQWMDQLLLAADEAEPRLDQALLRDALERGITARRAGAEHLLSRQLHQTDGKAPSAWWKSVLAQAERVVRRWTIALLASPLANRGFHITTERTLKATLLDDGKPLLAIHGRLDLCLREDRETVVLDYKSGDKPKPVKRETIGVDGAHLPLVVYLWLVHENNLPGPRVGLVTAGAPIQDDLLNESDLSRLRDLAAQLGLQQRELIFGQLGPLVADARGYCEALPMATIPIATAVLAQKAIASGLGFVAPPDEEDGDE